MTRTTPAMLELIERLEKATGRDFHINGDIAKALALHPVGWRRGSYHDSRHIWWDRDDKTGFTQWVAPNFTGSIDAALTLARDAEERKQMIIAMVNAFKNVDALDTFAWLKEAIIFALRARLSEQNVDGKDAG